MAVRQTQRRPVGAPKRRPVGELRDRKRLPPEPAGTNSRWKAIADLVFGLVASGGAVWLFLAYLGVA